VGAWIEINRRRTSHRYELVAPFVGAWIEMDVWISHGFGYIVAPFVGAWIEICLIHLAPRYVPSHPSWVRGLKLLWVLPFGISALVAPFVGAWIEI